MTAAILMLALSFAGPHEGEWLGADKQLHAGVSFGLTLGAHAVAAEKQWTPAVRFVVTTGFALGVGLAKELADHFDYGGFSKRDLIADVVGIAFGHLVYTVGAWVLR